jgi:very-short-patch-repair endonuclease
MAYIGKTKNPAYFYNADEETQEIAKSLRKRMTSAEKVLWQILKAKKIVGMKFRRQHPIAWYIADFYCHEIRLVIEIDGPIHECRERKEQDEGRTGIMNQYDIIVIRFTNDDVLNRPGRVIRRIKEVVNARLAKSG